MKLFLLIQGVLYVVIVSSDIGDYLTADWSNGIKLLSIVVCFMYLLMTYKPSKSSFDHALMIIVLGMTLFADTILLFSDQILMGLLLFVGVQLLYSFRITNIWSITHKYWYCYVAIALITGTVIFIQNEILLMGVVLFYGVLFIVNLRLLLMIYNQNLQKHRYFTIGFVLFLICDINVLLFNILPSYDVLNSFHEFTRISMWFFYLPAQVLLSLSGVNENPEY